LTEAGRLFRESARRIVEDAQQAFVEVQNAGRGETGRLSLGFAGSTVFHPMVATTMQQYRHAYERVSISCEESNSSLLLDRVAERQLDAALVRMPLNCRDLIVEPLVDEDMLAVLPANHRLSRRRRVDLADLADDPFILFPRPIGPDLHTTRSSLHAAKPASRRRSAWSRHRYHRRRISWRLDSALPWCPRRSGRSRLKACRITNCKGKPLSTGIALIHRPREKSPTVLNFVRILRQQRAATRTRNPRLLRCPYKFSTDLKLATGCLS
jgi:DNA-binding transcriptional LysR family regulator